MDTNLKVILQQLEAEKSIDRDTLIEAIRSAIESAARKGIDHAANVTVEVDPDTLAFKVFEIRDVVETVEDETTEIGFEAARDLNPDVEVGNRLKVPAEPKDFGRIAAQTAKQVIIQKIRDAERENVFDEFKQREGELITGSVKRVNAQGNIIVTIGKAETILPRSEQSPRENYKPGDRVRAFLARVEKGPRGPEIILSRTAPELVKALFELEVPEIYDGTIEIKGTAREPGSRTKIAVLSHDGNVDAVGACVGMKGSRVRAVVEELSGEKIDIVRWSEDPVELCSNALNPADILDMTLDEDSRTIVVVVPHDQLSLAIGKRGQNARLASRLIGWNIDIRSDTEIAGVAADLDEAAKAEAAKAEAAEAQAAEAEAAEAATSDVPPTQEDEPGAESEAGHSDDTPGSELNAAPGEPSASAQEEPEA